MSSLLVVFCLSSFFVGSVHSTTDNVFYHQQQKALLDFKSSLSYYNALANWIPSRSICNWTGITCDIQREQVISLHLADCFIEGTISPSLANISFLLSINLSANFLVGSIPPQLGSLSSLKELSLRGNRLVGSIPSALANLSALTFLDLGDNYLFRSIPTELSMLNHLQSLSLSQNYLMGNISDSLCTLQNLGSLNLSYNSLSGTMPICLKKLRMLSYLNLSFNCLEGDIDIGDFENSSIVISLNENSGLCRSNVFFLTEWPSEKGHSACLRQVLGPVGGVVAFMFCCLLLSFLWARKFKRQVLRLSQAIREILQNVEYPLITYHELFIATNGFNQANFLGASSFGSVYKGMLTDGTVFAVKVLNLNKQSEKSFKAECKVLQNGRHRNLARIITVCSNLQLKGLVYEFLSNGSLEEHLYPDRGHVSELGLEELLNIAIDIADAVKYLHHDCYVQIVHCNIKPSNVLLDHDMAPRLTDFGIARIMGGASIDSLTSTINLKGSVGYIAPEYGLNGRISVQGDVYSYGILLLEMITRKRPKDEMFKGDLNLHKWVNRAFPNQIGVVDESLLEKGRSKEVEEIAVSMLRIGLLCSKDSAEARPTMREVSSLLKTIREEWEASTNSSKKLRPCMTDLLREVEDSSETESC